VVPGSTATGSPLDAGNGWPGAANWQSSVASSRIVNQATARAGGGLQSARCILDLFHFEEIERLRDAGR
jgi:hypothetical protein